MGTSLSTSSFKRTVLFFIIFFVLSHLIGIWFETLHEANIAGTTYYPKLRWEEFYSLEPDSVDMLFLGSSHCYRSFDPELFNEKLGIRAFNLGSSSQSSDSGFFILREALKYQNPKLVVCEVYWEVLDEDYSPVQAIRNLEFMRPSINKISFFCHVLGLQDQLEYGMKILRYKKDFKLFLKNPLSSNTPSRKRTNEFYKGSGFVSSSGEVGIKRLTTDNQFINYKIPTLSPRQIDYVAKTIDYCKERDIPILLVTAPIPPYSLGLIEDYHSIYLEIASLAKEVGVEYLDYNYIGKGLFYNSDFKDDHHLNENGVRKLDHLLAEYVRAAGLI